MASDAARSGNIRKKASFHLPTETNPNPHDNGNRYPLEDEIIATITEINGAAARSRDSLRAGREPIE